MIVDNQLILGVVLIVIGIAFGLLAYAVLLNRREAEKEEVDQPVDERTNLTETDAEPEAGAKAQDEAEERIVPSPPVEEDAKSPPPKETGHIPIAALSRDELTGKLIIEVDGQVYRAAADVADETHRRKLQYAALDLAAWFESEKEPPRPAQSEEPVKQKGMIEEINEFLKKKLRHLPAEKQAVRLAEGVGGSVKVYIGIDSYPLEEVPDENIKQLIREAVADWEASR